MDTATGGWDTDIGIGIGGWDIGKGANVPITKQELCAILQSTKGKPQNLYIVINFVYL